jgi:hypothetical protein
MSRERLILSDVLELSALLGALALPRGDRQLNNNNGLARNLGKSGCVEYQSVSAPLPKPKFAPLYHSVLLWPATARPLRPNFA